VTEPDQSPKFFLDRGIGSVFVPEGLRENGWQVTTMDERYGTEASQDVADIDWIREATERGESLVTKDTAIARVPVEAQVVHMCDARVFTITSARITGPQMLERLLYNEQTVFRWASRTPAPFVLGIYENRTARIPLNYPPKP
jgi:hypothetical protein